MHPSRRKPRQTRHITTDEAIARQEGELVCRDCGQPCEKKAAIRGYRQSLKCPRCGGFLERHPQAAKEQAATETRSNSPPAESA
jgi:Zn finger protein HypA/HybF involved in hydrogenase expression